MKQALIKATVALEKSLWVVLFERMDQTGFAVAREIFGSEPTDPELYEFISNNFFKLKFTEPHEFKLIIKRKNPKRMRREVKKELKKAKDDPTISTHAQEILRIELEKNKKIRKSISKTEKEKLLDRKFLLKQTKRKKKHRGH